MMILHFLAAAVSFLPQLHAFSAQSSSSAYNTIQSANSLLDPSSGTQQQTSILSQNNKRKKSLVVLLPQLGEFDSAEYVEFLTAAQPSLEQNDIDLHIIGIGDTTAASNFLQFTNLSPDNLYIDPNGDLHKELELTCGPGLSVPDGVSNDVCKFFLRQLPGGVPEEEEMVRPVSTAWLNYMGELIIMICVLLKEKDALLYASHMCILMCSSYVLQAMCAGIGAPGTLREILRGYFGDKKAPERFRDDDVVKAGFITIVSRI